MEPSKKDKNKVQTLPGVATPDVSKDAVEKMRKNMPYVLELLTMNAQITWHKFHTLKAEGFSPAEALELCKKIF